MRKIKQFIARVVESLYFIMDIKIFNIQSFFGELYGV